MTQRCLRYLNGVRWVMALDHIQKIIFTAVSKTLLSFDSAVSMAIWNSNLSANSHRFRNYFGCESVVLEEMFDIKKTELKNPLRLSLIAQIIKALSFCRINTERKHLLRLRRDLSSLWICSRFWMSSLTSTFSILKCNFLWDVFCK
jgi:hypothetical protein